MDSKLIKNLDKWYMFLDSIKECSLTFCCDDEPERFPIIIFYDICFKGWYMNAYFEYLFDKQLFFRRK